MYKPTNKECHCSRTSRYHTVDSNYDNHSYERCWNAQVNAYSTTEQLRLGYDSSNYTSLTVSSTGRLIKERLVQPTIESVIEGKAYPIMIVLKDGKQIGIEYKDGKLVLVGDRCDIDEGATTLLEAIKDKLTTFTEGIRSEERKRCVEIVEKMSWKIDEGQLLDHAACEYHNISVARAVKAINTNNK